MSEANSEWIGILQVVITLAIPLSLEFRAVSRSWNYRWPWVVLLQGVGLSVAALLSFWILLVSLEALRSGAGFAMHSWLAQALVFIFGIIVVVPILPGLFQFTSVAFADRLIVRGDPGRVIRYSLKTRRALIKRLVISRSLFAQVYAARAAFGAMTIRVAGSRALRPGAANEAAGRGYARESLANAALAIHEAEEAVQLFQLALANLRKSARRYAVVRNEHWRRFSESPAAFEAFTSVFADASAELRNSSSDAAVYLENASRVVTNLQDLLTESVQELHAATLQLRDSVSPANARVSVRRLHRSPDTPGKA